MLKYNIVVSANNNNIIGIHNNLFIECKDDLKRFYKITTQEYPEGNKNICIMGYNTWLSIPENVRPFKNRMNIIVTKNHTIDEKENIKVFKSLKEAFYWSVLNQTGKIFVIGGSSIFDQCFKDYKNDLDCIYLTHFENNYNCTGPEIKRLPSQILEDTELIYKSKDYVSECIISSNDKETKIIQNISIYQSKCFINHSELKYLALLNSILDKNNRIKSRNGNVLNSFGERLIFDLKDGFPLLTTKKIGNKTILRELLWFIKGSTNNKELQDKKVHIWDQNSSKEFLKSRNLDYEEGDLGPIYGFQWRHFGAKYKDCYTNYKGLGIDQLQNIIDLIKNDPSSRRIIMSAWNPLDLDKMALPPCHVLCQFYVDTIQGKIDCQLYQRSGDMFLGVPFNIASYSFLLCIICHLTEYKPGKLIHILGDSHIYEDHINAVKQQIIRVPIQYPTLDISYQLESIDNIQEEHFTLENYQSYPKLFAPMIS